MLNNILSQYKTKNKCQDYCYPTLRNFVSFSTMKLTSFFSWLVNCDGQISNENDEEYQLVNQFEEYLDKYCKSESPPNYAVLVTGEWGHGKTHQVISYLDKFYNQIHEKAIYVSIFGLKSVDEIYNEIVANISPLSRGASNLKKIVNSVRNSPTYLDLAASTIPNMITNHIKTQIKDKIIVFDDLERASLKIEETLSVISDCLARGCKVIMITNSDKLKRKCEDEKFKFDEIKEKVVGQELRVIPNYEQAFDSFYEKLENKQKNPIIKEYRKTIIDTFKTTEYKSLRILEHVIRDIGKIIENIDKIYTNKRGFMEQFLRDFCILGQAFRSGKLSIIGLKKVFHKEVKEIVTENEKEVYNQIIGDLSKRSPNFHHFGIFTFEFYEEIFMRGLVDQGRVAVCLRKSIYSEERTKSWEILEKYMSYDVKILDQSYVKLIQELENKQFKTSDEMLEVFTVMLMLSDRKLIPMEFNNCVEFCKKYINETITDTENYKISDLIPFRNFSKEHCNKFKDFSNSKSQKFDNSNIYKGIKNLMDYLEVERKNELYNRKTELSDYILNLVQRNPFDFFEQFLGGMDTEAKFEMIPVLDLVSTKSFVDNWLELNAVYRGHIKDAIEGRMKFFGQLPEYDNERKWVESVIEELERRRNQSDGFTRGQIDFIIPDKSLADLQD